jgi:hypothetical protein
LAKKACPPVAAFHGQLKPTADQRAQAKALLGSENASPCFDADTERFAGAPRRREAFAARRPCSQA